MAEQNDHELDALTETEQAEIRRLAVVVVTELLAADMYGLRVLWNKHLPERDLEQLANLLGYSFD